MRSHNLQGISIGKASFPLCLRKPELYKFKTFLVIKKESKITDTVIEKMLSWSHSGFNVYIGGGQSFFAGLGN